MARSRWRTGARLPRKGRSKRSSSTDRHAIGTRSNLVENAVVYAPPNTEVVVDVNPRGCDVVDRGRIPAGDREHISIAFGAAGITRVRASGSVSHVSEIMRAHHGSVHVGNHPSAEQSLR